MPAAVLGESALQMQASYFLGQTYYAIGDFGRAAELWRRNVEAADLGFGTPSGFQLRSRAWLARTLSVLGASSRAGATGRRRSASPRWKAEGPHRLSPTAASASCTSPGGSLEHAIGVLDEGLTLCRASGERSDLRVIAAGLGFAYALQGRLAEGRALLEEAISESIRTAHRIPLGHTAQRGLVVWRAAARRPRGTPARRSI